MLPLSYYLLRREQPIQQAPAAQQPPDKVYTLDPMFVHPLFHTDTTVKTSIINPEDADPPSMKILYISASKVQDLVKTFPWYRPRFQIRTGQNFYIRVKDDNGAVAVMSLAPFVRIHCLIQSACHSERAGSPTMTKFFDALHVQVHL